MIEENVEHEEDITQSKNQEEIYTRLRIISCVSTIDRPRPATSLLLPIHPRETLSYTVFLNEESNFPGLMEASPCAVCYNYVIRNIGHLRHPS